jgi:hypothetical protein
MEASSTSNESMSFAEASRSPAKTSASPAKAPGSTGHARVFGESTPDSFAIYDPDTSSWRTSQLSLLEEWSEFSGTWPRAGMTRSGIAFRLVPLAPLTGGIASGLLPTPHGMCVPNDRRAGPSGNEREMRPTPRTSDTNGAGWHGTGGLDLRTAVAEAEWATPTAHPRTHTPRQVHHGRQLANEVGGSLNPAWVTKLMGFPVDWLDL